MRPAEIVKDSRLDAHPCLFSGTANPSDVCQVGPFAKMAVIFMIILHSIIPNWFCILNRVDWVIAGF